MADINLELSKHLFAIKFYSYLLDYTHRWEFYMGGAGSGKSYFITQKLILRCLNEKIKILVCRRYGTTIRNTCFSLFKDILAKWKLTQYVKIRETDFNISFPNGSEVIFMGLDEETKLLSLNDIGTIFIEEAYEVPQNIVEQLNLRMRGKNENQQIIMAWNPISQNHWLYNFSVVNPPENSIFIHSTYKDNPFLSPEYVASLEELRTRNPQKARIYCDGDWGIDTDGLVFTNWREEEIKDETLANLELRIGSDLGYRDATTLLISYYDRANKRIYVVDELYETGKQLDELAASFSNMNIGHHTKIYMDSAEPRSIQYFRNKGFNAVPCVKGRDSVKARILFLQNHEIIVKPCCTHLIEEFSNFSWIRDKKTNEFTDNTTHEFSHCIDGLGYAYSDIYTRRTGGVIDKAVLGL
jgi:phage terminase large subunit